MGKLRKGRCVKKNKHAEEAEPMELTRAPHSFVIHRGHPGKDVIELTKDFRRVMEPFTASSLKSRKKNTLKDFVSVAGFLHVSHLCAFSHTENSTYLRIAKLPRGPTLSFKVHSFSLSRDVLSTIKKQLVFEEAFRNSPLVILNSFSGEGVHLKLMATTFQNMFPTINLTSVNLSTIRRCVLLNYNPTTKLIDFRHFAIKAVPLGVSKGVKKVVQGKVPNLSRCNDISEFLTKSGILSESEFEDDDTGHVTLPQKLTSRGNHQEGKSAIRLSELGPRITLQLMKVEDGLLEGEVLFHELITKTEEEKVHIKKKRDEKKHLKEKRKRLQEINKVKKDSTKQELKQKSLAGMKKYKPETDRLMERAVNEANEGMEVEDNDAEYYREEVGEEPEKDLFDAQRPPSVRRPFVTSARHIRKGKPDSRDKNKSKSKDMGETKDFGRDRFKSNKNKSQFTKNKAGFKVKNKKLTSGGRFNRDRQPDKNKKVGGRGGNPKYGWRAQEGESEKSHKPDGQKKNKKAK